MQNNVKIKAFIDETGKWVRCGKCRYKLFTLIKAGDTEIEFKCHTCKSINTFGDIQDDVGRDNKINQV